MSWREGTVAGVEARRDAHQLSGERSYEVDVPAARRAEGAGKRSTPRAPRISASRPHGTEAMRVLRAEKGYVSRRRRTPMAR